MQIVLRAVFFVVALATSPAFSQDEKTERPPWWPEPGANEWDLDWPPPRPKNWPEGADWPPRQEISNNPKFWADLYSDLPDAEEDKRLAEPGETGSINYRYVFPQVHAFDKKTKPGCGLFVFGRHKQQRLKSCSPFPEKVVRKLCAEVFDERAVQKECSAICARNPREKRCSEGWLTLPPTDTGWDCHSFAFDFDGPAITQHDAVYNTFYICNYMEI